MAKYVEQNEKLLKRKAGKNKKKIADADDDNLMDASAIAGIGADDIAK